jgi:hypothetical protein
VLSKEPLSKILFFKSSESAKESVVAQKTISAKKEVAQHKSRRKMVFFTDILTKTFLLSSIP